MRYFHFGEGEYDVSEKVIQALLKEAGANVGGIVSKPDTLIEAQTPETYLGYDRGQGFASAVAPVADAPADYKPARQPANGEWNLTGTWTITPQYVLPGDERHAAARVRRPERLPGGRACGQVLAASRCLSTTSLGRTRST